MKPADEARIRELADQGLSARAIGREVGFSHVTVSKVLKKPAAAIQERAKAIAPNTPDEPAAEIDPDAPALTIVRGLLADSRREVEACRAIGDARGVQQATRTAAALTPVLARLEAQQAEDRDMLRISRADIHEKAGEIRGMVRALSERGGMRCKDCDRELSIRLAGPETVEKVEAARRARERGE